MKGWTSSPGFFSQIWDNKNIDNDIDMVDVDGKTALYDAIEKGDILLLEPLLEHNANTNIEDRSDGRSPLHKAVIQNDEDYVEHLICFKANVNHRDVWGWTALDYALAIDNKKIIDLLIGNGANLDVKDLIKTLSFIYLRNPLEIQHILRHPKIYDEMIKLAKTEVLFCAVRYNNIPMVYYLLRSGVDVNASNHLGSTALHEAANSGNLEVAKILIIHGAKINAQDYYKLTALHNAVSNKHWQVVKTLIFHRADLSLQDNCGETVKDLAKIEGTSNSLRIVEERAQAMHVKPSMAPCMVRSTASLLSSSLERMMREQTNGISHLQLQPSTELYEGRVTPITNGISHLQLGPNTNLHEASLTSNFIRYPYTALDMVEWPIAAMKNMCTVIKNRPSLNFRL